METLERIQREDESNLQDLFNSYDPVLIHSYPQFKSDLFKRDLGQTLITDFFGRVQSVELTAHSVKLGSNNDSDSVDDEPVSPSAHAHASASPSVVHDLRKLQPIGTIFSTEFQIALSVSMGVFLLAFF